MEPELTQKEKDICDDFRRMNNCSKGVLDYCGRKGFQCTCPNGLICQMASKHDINTTGKQFSEWAEGEAGGVWNWVDDHDRKINCPCGQENIGVYDIDDESSELVCDEEFIRKNNCEPPGICTDNIKMCRRIDDSTCFINRNKGKVSNCVYDIYEGISPCMLFMQENNIKLLRYCGRKHIVGECKDGSECIFFKRKNGDKVYINCPCGNNKGPGVEDWDNPYKGLSDHSTCAEEFLNKNNCLGKGYCHDGVHSCLKKSGEVCMYVPNRSTRTYKSYNCEYPLLDKIDVNSLVVDGHIFDPTNDDFFKEIVSVDTIEDDDVDVENEDDGEQNKENDDVEVESPIDVELDTPTPFYKNQNFKIGVALFIVLGLFIINYVNNEIGIIMVTTGILFLIIIMVP